MMKTMTLADLFQSLADPTRLRILLLLGEMELAVGELAQLLDQSQPRVSRHVRILCEAGLARRHKEGSWVFLRRLSETPTRAALASLLDDAITDDPGLAAQFAADRARLAEIRATREAQAAEYFARHAAQWDVLRSMHSADAPVEDALIELLGDGAVQAMLDVGTGTGRIAELLSPNAQHITALDKSPEMLRLARARLAALPASRLALVQGDFLALPFEAASFDLVTLHQVLHFAQQPEAVLAEVARVTAPGGRIALVDFGPHDQEELRARHAHARLGFSAAQMTAMLAAAGFADIEQRAIPGNPLTVMIWIARKLTHPAALHERHK